MLGWTIFLIAQLFSQQMLSSCVMITCPGITQPAWSTENGRSWTSNVSSRKQIGEGCPIVYLILEEAFSVSQKRSFPSLQLQHLGNMTDSIWSLLYTSNVLSSHKE